MEVTIERINLFFDTLTQSLIPDARQFRFTPENAANLRSFNPQNLYAESEAQGLERLLSVMSFLALEGTSGKILDRGKEVDFSVERFCSTFRKQFKKWISNAIEHRNDLCAANYPSKIDTAEVMHAVHRFYQFGFDVFLNGSIDQNQLDKCAPVHQRIFDGHPHETATTKDEFILSNQRFASRLIRRQTIEHVQHVVPIVSITPDHTKKVYKLEGRNAHFLGTFTYYYYGMGEDHPAAELTLPIYFLETIAGRRTVAFFPRYEDFFCGQRDINIKDALLRAIASFEESHGFFWEYEDPEKGHQRRLFTEAELGMSLRYLDAGSLTRLRACVPYLATQTIDEGAMTEAAWDMLHRAQEHALLPRCEIEQTALFRALPDEELNAYCRKIPERFPHQNLPPIRKYSEVTQGHYRALTIMIKKDATIERLKTFTEDYFAGKQGWGKLTEDERKRFENQILHEPDKPIETLGELLASILKTPTDVRGARLFLILRNYDKGMLGHAFKPGIIDPIYNFYEQAGEQSKHRAFHVPEPVQAPKVTQVSSVTPNRRRTTSEATTHESNASEISGLEQRAQMFRLKMFDADARKSSYHSDSEAETKNSVYTHAQVVHKQEQKDEAPIARSAPQQSYINFLTAERSTTNKGGDSNKEEMREFRNFS